MCFLESVRFNLNPKGSKILRFCLFIRKTGFQFSLTNSDMFALRKHDE